MLYFLLLSIVSNKYNVLLLHYEKNRVKYARHRLSKFAASALEENTGLFGNNKVIIIIVCRTGSLNVCLSAFPLHYTGKNTAMMASKHPSVHVMCGVVSGTVIVSQGNTITGLTI